MQSVVDVRCFLKACKIMCTISVSNFTKQPYYKSQKTRFGSFDGYLVSFHEKRKCI